MRDLAWARAHVQEADRLGRLQARVMRERRPAWNHLRALRAVCDHVEVISGGDGHMEPYYHIVATRKGSARHVTIDENETAAVCLAYRHWVSA